MEFTTVAAAAASAAASISPSSSDEPSLTSSWRFVSRRFVFVSRRDEDRVSVSPRPMPNVNIGRAPGTPGESRTSARRRIPPGSEPSSRARTRSR